MATFKDFIKDPEGVRPRTDRGRHGRVRRPDRTIYKDDINESMLKGVWRMAISDNGYEEDEEDYLVDCPECEGTGISLGKECPECAGEGKLYDGPEDEDPYNISGQRWSEEDQEEDMDLDLGDEEAAPETDPEMDQDMGSEEPAPDELDEPEDPDRAGIIRQVDGAHLIYKRQVEDSTYEELWIYNINDKIDDELDIRRAIIAGTDIEPNKTRSEDGTQTYKLSTMGNAQYVHIKGLPN